MGDVIVAGVATGSPFGGGNWVAEVCFVEGSVASGESAVAFVKVGGVVAC
jgi:hypothetical protein